MKNEKLIRDFNKYVSDIIYWVKQENTSNQTRRNFMMAEAITGIRSGQTKIQSRLLHAEDTGYEETDKYNLMLMAFSDDFDMAADGRRNIGELQKHIDDKEEGLMRDIKLLKELEGKVRTGEVKILEKK